MDFILNIQMHLFVHLAPAVKQSVNLSSWLNCKFTRFFVAINPTKLTGIITNDNF